MGDIVFAKIAAWNARRYRLIQLRHELDRAQCSFDKDAVGLNRRSDEWERRYADYRADSDILLAEIGAIETLIHFKRALRWRAPIPPHPTNRDLDNDYWSWDKVLGGYQLTPLGQREIRHAVAAEIDLYYRPWISWGALRRIKGAGCVRSVQAKKLCPEPLHQYNADVSGTVDFEFLEEAKTWNIRQTRGAGIQLKAASRTERIKTVCVNASDTTID